ncbi:hypothetical protein ambt_18040 [Alteromonas naphthalenivorans]|uniref:Uncharacterized protein n=1 Tax=Alteromonas naphthalenivorans TaxID=715451 RepID=F5ZFH2_ALTNA|nr:hypothetical protein ambt_18040 [Alteromonas naphthalenivorans]
MHASTLLPALLADVNVHWQVLHCPDMQLYEIGISFARRDSSKFEPASTFMSLFNGDTVTLMATSVLKIVYCVNLECTESSII